MIKWRPRHGPLKAVASGRFFSIIGTQHASLVGGYNIGGLSRGPVMRSGPATPAPDPAERGASLFHRSRDACSARGAASSAAPCGSSARAASHRGGARVCPSNARRCQEKKGSGVLSMERGRHATAGCSEASAGINRTDSRSADLAAAGRRRQCRRGACLGTAIGRQRVDRRHATRYPGKVRIWLGAGGIWLA